MWGAMSELNGLDIAKIVQFGGIAVVFRNYSIGLVSLTVLVPNSIYLQSFGIFQSHILVKFNM